MRKIFLAMWLFSATLNVMADNKPSVVVNGEPLQGKTLSRMTFSGTDVTLLFNDNTSDTYDMNVVRVVFATITGINDVNVAEKHGIIDGNLVVDGIPAGTIINVYDMNGRIVVSEKSAGETVRISVDVLQDGVYIMSAAGTVVKFIKK